MDKLVKHAIRMLEIVEGENDFYRNDAKRQADTARAVYDTILRVQALERNADRKTESNSEKPNNCEDCANGEGDIEACGYCRHGDLYEPKDEPHTDNGIGCSRCEGRYDCYDRDMPIAVHCNNYGKITDEPQTDCAWKNECK